MGCSGSPHCCHRHSSVTVGHRHWAQQAAFDAAGNAPRTTTTTTEAAEPAPAVASCILHLQSCIRIIAKDDALRLTQFHSIPTSIRPFHLLVLNSLQVQPDSSSAPFSLSRTIPKLNLVSSSRSDNHSDYSFAPNSRPPLKYRPPATTSIPDSAFEALDGQEAAGCWPCCDPRSRLRPRTRPLSERVVTGRQLPEA